MNRINLVSILLVIVQYLSYSQSALPCNNNIYCDPAANSLPADIYVNNARSVMKLINSEGEPCSCTLLRQGFSSGDDNQQENIIITARHCIRKGSAGFGDLTDLNQMQFIFNFSNPDCQTSPNIAFSIKQNRYKLTGATLIDESSIHDIAVLKLNNPIPPHFKPYYSGWTAILLSSLSGGFFDIHHPSGDIKKISSTNGVTHLPIPTRYNVTWVDGRTQAGSSGSGLFNLNRRLIGVLSGNVFNPNQNNETCFNSQFANFGKFRNFWLGNSVTRNKLNPNNTFGLIGFSGGEIECYSNDLFLDGNYWPAGDYQPTNQITLKCQGNMYLAHSNKILTVFPGAEFHFEAGGQVIKALPGFKAMAGSIVSIKSNMACTPMRMMNSIESSDVDSNIVNYYYDKSKGELPKEGISSLQPNSFLQIFPNPSNGKFKIKSLGYTTDPYSFDLIDVNGKIIYSITGNYFDNGEEEIFSFTELPPGVYMFKIENEATKMTEYKRVIIQK